jgi:DNA-binding CsgD family transcriptional regulator
MSIRSTQPTPGELRVLRAVIEYGTVAATARALHLSRHTVDTHIDHLRHRTCRRHLHQIVAWAAQNGWLTPEHPTGKK